MYSHILTRCIEAIPRTHRFRNDSDKPSALLDYTHIWVDKDTERPTAIPEELRAALDGLRVEE